MVITPNWCWMLTIVSCNGIIMKYAELLDTTSASELSNFHNSYFQYLLCKVTYARVRHGYSNSCCSNLICKVSISWVYSQNINN